MLANYFFENVTFVAIAANVPSADAVPDKDRENAEHLFAVKRNFIVEPLDIPGIAVLRYVRHSRSFEK